VKTGRIQFDHVQENYENYLAAPHLCGRCGRTFLAGQRVRLHVAGVVERVLPRQNFALLNVRHIQQWWEHENPDHCTEPR
jgi:hypothetical protein